MEELNTPIFAQAKVEYTKQLIDILYPHMFDGVKSIYDESKIIYSSKTGTPILLLFRELLEKVPIWNGEIIDSESSRILNNSKCDWIDDLITAVFISHTKILTSIGPNQSFQRINLTIPKTSSFIHKAYINTARELWKNPYLFNENVPGHEYQKNSKEIENIIKNCIENTIRNLLPIKEILKEHLDNETETNIANQKDEIKNLLREELKELKSQVRLNMESDNNNENDENKNNDNDNDNDNEYDNKDESPSGESELEVTIIRENDNDELKDDIIPELVEKLEEITDKEITDKEITDKEITDKEIADKENVGLSLFPTSDDPSDEQVKNQCTDIVVNDITIPVEVPGEGTNEVPGEVVNEVPNEVIEVKYDNIDLVSNEKVQEDPERLKRLVTNMEVKETVNVIKTNETKGLNETPEIQITYPQGQSDGSFLQTDNPSKTVLDPEIIKQPEPEPEPAPAPAPAPKSSFSLNTLYPNMNTIPENEDISNKTENKSPPVEELKSPRKEVVALENNDNDIDETSSLANFFQDMKQIAEDKGIKVEGNNENKFTLFEDANEVEK